MPIMTCTRPECQTTAGCAYRGAKGEFCRFAAPDEHVTPLPQGCICPPTSEQTCRNPNCPRAPLQPVSAQMRQHGIFSSDDAYQDEARAFYSSR